MSRRGDAGDTRLWFLRWSCLAQYVCVCVWSRVSVVPSACIGGVAGLMADGACCGP